MNNNMNEVVEITAEELQQIAGGAGPVPGVIVRCARCAGEASKYGFVVRNEKGSILKVRFGHSLCDSCANEELALYLSRGCKFETWM